MLWFWKQPNNYKALKSDHQKPLVYTKAMKCKTVLHVLSDCLLMNLNKSVDKPEQVFPD